MTTIEPQSHDQKSMSKFSPGEMYTTYADFQDVNGRRNVLEGLSRAYADPEKNVIPRSVGESRRAVADSQTFRNISQPNISVRDAFDKSDYDYFRPGEAIPVKDRDIIRMCMQAYERFSIVKSVIDLMADFACKDISIVHPSPRVQKFGQDWFKKADGPNRSERLMSILYRAGNTVVQRKTAKLPDTTLDVLRAKAADMKVPQAQKLPPGEIPIGYTILDPRQLELIGGELAPFVAQNKLQYAVRVPDTLAKMLKHPKDAGEKSLISLVPIAVMDYAISANKLIPVPPEKTIPVHYKKDDHEIWAKPLLYSMLDDLVMLQKLRLADKSALDGAISHIRLWRIGNLEHKIFPTDIAIGRLSDMLINSVAGGCADLIWGPELDLVESSSDQVKFLSPEKYQMTLASLYQGLGVPPSLTGVGQESGFTNNVVSLKVLIERLEYGRKVLEKFWQDELDIIQQVFGFRQPFKVAFGVPSLSDDSAEKKLLIELLDRDIISPEFVQEKFGADPEIEEVRIRRGWRKRKDGASPPKAGPFHVNSRLAEQNLQAFVQQGAVTPSQAGVELQPNAKGQKPPFEMIAEANKPEEPAGAPAQQANPKTGGFKGRPQGAGDEVKRKTKRVTPKQSSKASLAVATVWAGSALNQIDDLIRPAFLRSKGKESLRELSSAESQEYEEVKFAAVCATELETTPTRESVKTFLLNPVSVPEPVTALVRTALGRFTEVRGHEPTLDEARQMRAAALALYKADLPDGVFPEQGDLNGEDFD